MSYAAHEERLPGVSEAERKRLLTQLLKGVSRAFYLTLRVLPKGLREPIGLAYLLARAADTIADTRLLPPEQRLRHLLSFRAQVQGPASMQTLREIGESLTDKQSIPDERRLLSSLPQVFSVLESLPTSDRERVRSIVIKLTQGMEIDLTKFPSEDSGQIVALKDLLELDDYIYYVAGCVGEFWTEMTMAHVPSLRGWDAEDMSKVGLRFGKALQLTNVLRDVPKDLHIGRCYLPESEFTPLGIAPQDLLEASNGSKARPALIRGIEIALEHYEYAEKYLLAIPRRNVRLRLAVAWPVLIGLATLAELAHNDAWLDSEKPSKVTRKWVYRMMGLSTAAVSSNSALSAWIRKLRGQVAAGL